MRDHHGGILDGIYRRVASWGRLWHERCDVDQQERFVGRNRERMAGLATQDVLARTRAFNEAGVAASRAKRLQKERAQAASDVGRAFPTDCGAR